jgi:hypothetical protein
MTKRNSPKDVQSLDDLSRIDEIIVDKRLGKRANEKRNRRNRHYGKQFIKNTLNSVQSAHSPIVEMLGALESDDEFQ